MPGDEGAKTSVYPTAVPVNRDVPGEELRAPLLDARPPPYAPSHQPQVQSAMPVADPVPPMVEPRPPLPPPHDTTTVVLVPADLRHPLQVRCPSCGRDVVTVVKTEPSLFTYLACMGLAMIGCVYGCCLVPFVMRDCQNSRHTCPVCDSTIVIG